VALVIARKPEAAVAISYPSKVEAVPVSKRLTMTSHKSNRDGVVVATLALNLLAVLTRWV
jgi:hypothetical protein